MDEIDFTIKELSEEAKVSKPMVRRAMKKFLEFGLVKMKEEKGKAIAYEINMASPFIDVILAFNNVLTEHILPKETLHQIYIRNSSNVDRGIPVVMIDEPTIWNQQSDWVKLIGTPQPQNIPTQPTLPIIDPISPVLGGETIAT